MPRPPIERISLGLVPWRRVNSSTGSTSSGSFNPAAENSVYAFERVHAGSITPGWKNLSRRQRLKAAPLSHSVNAYVATGHPYNSTTLSWLPNGNSWTVTYDVDNSLGFAVRPGVTHLSEAYVKARADCASQMNKMHLNLAQAFAERKQTANLIIDTAYRIATMARQLKRGNIPGIVDGFSAREADRLRRSVRKQPPSKRVANHWLEIQYGWKPLLSDVHGLAELLASRSLERIAHKVVGRGVADISGFASAPPLKLSEERYTKARTVTKICLEFSLDSATRAGLAQVGLDNPALLAWELLPYSFVVDWFLPVGNYLEALNAFSGFSFSSGWISQSTKQQNTTIYVGASPTQWNGSSYSFTSQKGQYSFRQWKYERTVLNTFPGIGFPQFRNPLGGNPVERFATAISLMRTAFK